MAILQQHYVLQVQCDCGCKRVAQVETSDNFHDAWYRLMQLGWVCLAKGWSIEAGNEYRAPGCKP